MQAALPITCSYRLGGAGSSASGNIRVVIGKARVITASIPGEGVRAVASGPRRFKIALQGAGCGEENDPKDRETCTAR